MEVEAKRRTVKTLVESLMSTSGLLEYKPIIGSKRDFIIDIVRSPSSHPRSIKDSLKALFGILLYPPNRAAVIELGAVSMLFSLVTKDGRVRIMEDATTMIAQIAGCEEVGEAFYKVSGIGVLVDLLDQSMYGVCLAIGLRRTPYSGC